MSQESHDQKEILVAGSSASPGIAYGEIFVYLQSDVEVPSYQVDPIKRIDEIARFDQALLITRQQIAKIQSEVEKNLGKDEALIFDAHLLVLEDQALITETIREFETTSRNIETCFDKVSRRYIQAFSEIDDEYLRERAGDIRDVAQRVLQNLLGQAENSLSRLAERRIVVANDLSPSDSASIDRSAALAIVTDSGSKTSHAVIVALSMKLPGVVGVRDLTKRAKTGDWAIVDGYQGIVILHPSEQTLFRYGQIQLQKKSFEQRMIEANRQPAVTLDGVEVTLLANIEKVGDIAQVQESFAARRRTLPDRVPLFELGADADRAGAVPGLQDGRRGDRAAPRHHPHARSRRRQAGGRQRQAAAEGIQSLSSVSARSVIAWRTFRTSSRISCARFSWRARTVTSR